MTEPALSCKNVWKLYGRHDSTIVQNAPTGAGATALAQQLREDGIIVAATDVSFDVKPGEIFVIMGLSGSGKSTMVRCLSRLVEPSAGEVWLDGQNLLKASPKELIDFRRHKMGMVFQSFGLLPHLTVAENIEFPLKLQGQSRKQRRERVREVIDLVSLAGREGSLPRQLSGGQQQRVGIARSLAVGPDIWFLDEPFSALDPLIRRQMQDEFMRIQASLKKTIVFITHDFQEALRIADRMMIMKDGAVVQTATPTEMILNPVNDYVAQFSADVPWSKVLCARDVACPSNQIAADAPSVPGYMPLEQVITKLAGIHSGLAVTGPDGTTLGGINAHAVVAALAGERRGNDAAPTAKDGAQ